jgi:uncharacterized protein YgbK (DUF1537 family)
MGEADLRRHLAQQGLVQIGGLDYTAYEAPEAGQLTRLQALHLAHPDAVLLDVVRPADLVPVGRLIWRAALQQPLLAVGPSSVVQALTAAWAADETSMPAAQANLPIGPSKGPVLVLAGSLSPITATQVQHATSFSHVALDPAQLVNADGAYRQRLALEVAAALQDGHHVLACTSSAGGSPAAGLSIGSRQLALACGEWLATVLNHTSVRRVGIAGATPPALRCRHSTPGACRIWASSRPTRRCAGCTATSRRSTAWSSCSRAGRWGHRICSNVWCAAQPDSAWAVQWPGTEKMNENGC